MFPGLHETTETKVAAGRSPDGTCSGSGARRSSFALASSQRSPRHDRRRSIHDPSDARGDIRSLRASEGTSEGSQWSPSPHWRLPSIVSSIDLVHRGATEGRRSSSPSRRGAAPIARAGRGCSSPLRTRPGRSSVARLPPFSPVEDGVARPAWHHRWMDSDGGADPPQGSEGTHRLPSPGMVLLLVCIGRFMVVLDSTIRP